MKTMKIKTKQKYTSANTSINKKRVPAVFKKISWKPNTINLDIGGGKYDTATIYLHRFYVENLIIDEYNRSEEHNFAMLEKVYQNGGADTVTCSNVLNVISEKEIRLDVINKCYDNLKDDGICYFYVYEGDSSGIGKETKKDCWQNNLKTKYYLSEVLSIFGSAFLKGKLIISSK